MVGTNQPARLSSGLPSDLFHLRDLTLTVTARPSYVPGCSLEDQQARLS